jgi:HSP20 family molecular chaperone IbpA
MANKEFPVKSDNTESKLSREETRAADRYAAPAVNILENQDGLTLLVDMPGVGKEDLKIDLHQGILTIEGRTQPVAPAEDIYREFTLGHFYRQFRVPEGIDPEKVTAGYRHGVLSLQLPRAEAAKPRRIEIAHE